MKELKTLKDFENEFNDIFGSFHTVDTKDLRKEAIKWVKNYKEIISKKRDNSGTAFPCVCGLNPMSCVCKNILPKIEVLMDFFNLKESDLK